MVTTDHPGQLFRSPSTHSPPHTGHLYRGASPPSPSPAVMPHTINCLLVGHEWGQGWLRGGWGAPCGNPWKCCGSLFLLPRLTLVTARAASTAAATPAAPAVVRAPISQRTALGLGAGVFALLELHGSGEPGQGAGGDVG
jgi:hypothetical protein